MKINRNNYEPYFIDYLEGNLDESLVDDFIEFLTTNPDLKEELALFEPVSVEPADVVFGKKELLFKEQFDLESEFNHAAVASIEGDFSDDEKIAFEKYVSNHPEKSKELALFAKTKLVADENIVFSKKNKLYKTPVVKTFLLWGSRIAALVILAVAVYLFVEKNQNETAPNQTIATTGNSTVKPEPTSENTNLTENKKEFYGTVLSEPKSTGPQKLKKNKTENENFEDNPEVNQMYDELAMNRQPVEMPLPIQSLPASVDLVLAEASLETMYITIPELEDFDEERLLVDIVKEKTGFQKFSLNKITKAGLNLVTSISNEKFTYQTNEAGKITEIIYDSRLLAFTIPTKTEARSGE